MNPQTRKELNAKATALRIAIETALIKVAADFATTTDILEVTVDIDGVVKLSLECIPLEHLDRIEEERLNGPITSLRKEWVHAARTQIPEMLGISLEYKGMVWQIAGYATRSKDKPYVLLTPEGRVTRVSRDTLYSAIDDTKAKYEAHMKSKGWKT